MMDGYGTFTWPNGNTFEGYYRLDKKEGYGKFIWNDGRWYEGEWQNGSQHGKGKYKSNKEDSIPFEGRWRNGKLIKKLK
jgi:hypothetical protein